MSDPDSSTSNQDALFRLASFLMADPSAARLASLKEISKPLSVDRGMRVALPANEDHYLFTAQGAAKLVAQLGPDRDQVLSFHFAGDLVWMPRWSAYELTMLAITSSEFILTPAAKFHALAHASSELTTLIDRMYSALEQSRQSIVLLGRKTALERLADFLVTMSQRIGFPEPGFPGVIRVPMSRRDIADHLGLTIETVSRQFSELRACGVIEVKSRSLVRVMDPERLIRLSRRKSETQ